MNTNLNMQTMPIDRLKPAKYNPRKDLKPGDPAYEKVKRSLHDFGYYCRKIQSPNPVIRRNSSYIPRQTHPHPRIARGAVPPFHIL